MPSDPKANEWKVYRRCMEKVRERLDIIEAVAAGRTTTRNPALDSDLVAVQFRKVLELIAYSSLAANREKYAAAHAAFASHWKAKRILEDLRKINPDFYPIPIQFPGFLEDGVEHCDNLPGGYLTENEFAVLYDGVSEILHMQNPFSSRPVSLPAEYSVDGWASRIRTLLANHTTRLVNGDVLITVIPSHGRIQIALGMKRMQ